MVKVELQGIRKDFGNLTIIPELNLRVDSGEFLVLVGPSGCGKSTILRMVAGLDDPTAGTITLGDRVVNDVSPKDREVAMVFQNYALYPHMTVRENLGFSLKMAKVPPAILETRILEAADVLGIRDLLERRPSQLSGGQKQRVAMGRAMVRHPKVLLFDEPLSNLDAQLRIKVRSEIAHLHKRIRSTVIYVTHDQTEAMTLAQRIAVLNQGRLEQLGTPLELYHRPRTQFVASFIGTPPMNFMPVHCLPPAMIPSGAATAGFRPEITHAGTTAAGPAQVAVAQGKVVLIEPLGSTTHVHVRVAESNIVAEVKTPMNAAALDSDIRLWINPADFFFFDRSGATLPGTGAGHA